MVDYLTNEAEALKLALHNELKSYDFYKAAEKKAKSNFSKKTFSFLAEQELGHIDMIKEFIEDSEEHVDADVQMESKEDFFEKSKDFFENTIRHFAQKLKADKTDLNIYTVAMEIETSGFEYYKKALEKAKTKNLKIFFRFLMEQEQFHYQLLENSYSYLNNPQGFFFNQENWNFEGG